MSDATYFTLEEFGSDKLSSPSMSVNDELMVFPTFDSAALMAEWMLEGGPEDGKQPIIGIIRYTYNPATEDDSTRDEGEAWSEGWVEYKDGIVSRHVGDYENDPDIWKTDEEKVATAKAIEASVAQAVNEIVRDVQQGVVPKVVNFSELHDHVDANEYGGLTTKWGDLSIEDAAKVQEEVDLFIKKGGLINVRVDKKREFLVHLNIQIPVDKIDSTVGIDDVEHDIEAAVAGLARTPLLQAAEIVIALGEEI